MYDKILKELEYISQAVGNRVDYTQGGGGNTSAKLNEELMAVKASGYKLKQITPGEGYVVVNYQKLVNYYEKVDLSQDRDYEKESAEFVRANLVEMVGLKKLRPSVEAGFHSVLKKFVIHTHPVYANILCCTHTGQAIVEKIFANKPFATAWVPYINPGFCLTLEINEIIKDTLKQRGKFPKVIFMENHGLIVTAEDSQACVRLHQEVNDAIKDYLGIKEAFPMIELKSIEKNRIISKTEYLIDFFKNNQISIDFFDKNVLYPDQLVYLNGNVAIDSMEKKLNVNTETGEIVYNTDYSEAQIIEETLLAYLYVVEGIKKSGFPLKVMSEKEVDFIKNWESEAYRKSLVQELGK